MTDQRLVRTGVAHPADNGCTSVEVRVPCTGCRTGCWGARRSPDRIRIIEPGTFAPGEAVRLSISARGFSAVCGWLFGPAIIAVIGLGLLLDDASFTQAGTQAGNGPEAASGLLILLALVPGLWLGRRLAQARLSSLDLRLLPGFGTDAD